MNAGKDIHTNKPNIKITAQKDSWEKGKSLDLKCSLD